MAQDLLYNLEEVKEMNTQQSLTDIEYQGRRRQTKRDNFLETMDRLVPWKAWSEKVEPFYYPGERGRKPIPIERMLRMLMLSVSFLADFSSSRTLAVTSGVGLKLP